MELGRSIVGNAVVLVGRVKAVSDSQAIIDISINDLGAFNKPKLSNPSLVIANKIRYHKKYSLKIGGPTPHPGDVISIRQKVPRLQVRDVVTIFNVGAYSISSSLQFTKGRIPVYIKKLSDSGKIFCIRRKENYKDILRTQKLEGLSGS